MERTFRDKETLTKKDMVFAAVNILATEDKRRLNGVERLAYVLTTAQQLLDWVQNSRVDNSSADATLLECERCFSNVPESEVCEMMQGGNLVFFCRECFDSTLFEQRSEE